MHSTIYFYPLAAACLAFTMSSSTHAAKPIHLQTSNFTTLQQQFFLALPGQRALSNSINSLKFLQKTIDKHQITHTRMQQQYLGFPVFGGYAILHSSGEFNPAALSKISMNGVVYKDLSADLGQVSAEFVSNAPLALNAFTAQFKASELSEEQVTPLIFIDKQKQAHWAYKVTVLITHKDKIPERPTAIIDAQDFKPFIQWNDIKTLRTPIKGMGFGGNFKIGEYTYGKDYPLLELTRESMIKTCYMENYNVKVVDMMHSTTAINKPIKFSCMRHSKFDPALYWTGYSADGYDRINGAYSPSNDAMYAGSVIKKLYKDWYDVEVLKRRGIPMQLVMRVHYGLGFENAYWDGNQMTFGDGDAMLYPLVSLGIGAHEVSHGFTEQNSGLEYYGQSGGLNESFSDMAAAAAEFYVKGTTNWLIGGEIIKEDSGLEALRYMDKPSRDGSSIDSASQYYEGLDVHFSSGVYNRFFYLLATSIDWDTRKAFDVMVKANLDYWTPYSDYEEAACGILAAAQDLQYPLGAIKTALNAVAVGYNSCEASTAKL